MDDRRYVPAGAMGCPVCGEKPEITLVYDGASICAHDHYFISHGLVRYDGMSEDEAVSSWNDSVNNYEAYKDNWHLMCGWKEVSEEGVE